MSETKRILVVLADLGIQDENTDYYVNRLVIDFIKEAKTEDMTTDIINLYSDDEFNDFKNLTDTKILEYQIRINRSDCIYFFHSLSQLFVPSILKLFLEKLFDPTLTTIKENQTQLENKIVETFVFASNPKWKILLPYGNLISDFWQKAIFDPNKIKGGLSIFGKANNPNEKTLRKWQKAINNKLPDRTTTKSILDLF